MDTDTEFPRWHEFLFLRRSACSAGCSLSSLILRPFAPIRAYLRLKLTAVRVSRIRKGI
jgi:hypothetical protein